MDIFKNLPEADVALLNRYINYYGGSEERGSYMPLAEMEYFLRFWAVNKAPFYNMFGEQFILKKEICFEQDPDLLEEDLDNSIRYGDALVWAFRRKYMECIDKMISDFDMKYELKRFVDDIPMLIKNEYDGEPFCIPGRFTTDRKPLQINKGAKAIKTLGKICKALNIEEVQYWCPVCGTYEKSQNKTCKNCGTEIPSEKRDGYEMFRRNHSLVLNQKKLKGNLCLSIHPLDFITMSDNNCGWSSCMQWVDEPGDYRLGTIEMMNSPYCVIAYVEAKDPMPICTDDFWNSKRWRQLLMITPEMILGNKQYPYFNDNLQGTAMKWLRDLANDYKRTDPDEEKFGPYEEEALQIRNHRWNTIGNEEVYVNFEFTYMYNDIYDLRMAFIARHCNETRIEYNLSGPAVCTECGDIIEKNADYEVEPNWTTCRSCNGMWRCGCCGDWHYGDAYYCEDSDEPYCEYCYRTETEICEVCGDHVVRTEKIFIQLLNSSDDETETYNWNFVIDTCKNCIGSSEFEELFGPIRIRKDMYGRDRQFVHIDNITERGLDGGTMDSYSRTVLKEIGSIESDEDRVVLLRKKLY